MSENGNNGIDSAIALLDQLNSYCKSDLLSEDGLRELIERHGFTSKNNRSNDNALVSDNYQFFHYACWNKRVNEGIIRCLLEYFPDAVSVTDEEGRTPLHLACCNPSLTLQIIEVLIDAAPTSVRSANSRGMTPLLLLCGNKRKKETVSVELLKLLIEKHPEAVRHANNEGHLPIHMASATESPDFCRVLIEAYPGSERITDGAGALPFHCACLLNTVATIDYLYKLYPDAINHATTLGGYYPIQDAIGGLRKRANPEEAIESVQYLLDCDPIVKLQKRRGRSLLHYACRKYIDSDIVVALEVIKTIYDAHPEAIEENRIVANIQRYHPQVGAFLNTQLAYARQAKDLRQMNTPDDNGQLPLHRALQNNVRSGSIKLLVKGNPSSLRVPDNNFAMPLHIACQHHDSASVVQCLLDLDMRTLRAVDFDNNTALHYACRGARHEIIALLLEKYDAISVSKRNAQKKLPIDLLWESNAVSDRESVEYTGSIYQLLRANPEMMFMTSSMTTKQLADVDATRIRKKRKCGHGH